MPMAGESDQLIPVLPPPDTVALNHMLCAAVRVPDAGMRDILLEVDVLVAAKETVAVAV